MSVVGVVGWCVIMASVLTWEGVGLADGTKGWPTLSDMLRTATSSVAGRWILFGLWLWLGWHLFVRGWQFFLRR
jgi:hypothetical protein